jgi:hypothetical protein
MGGYAVEILKLSRKDFKSKQQKSSNGILQEPHLVVRLIEISTQGL